MKTKQHPAAQNVKYEFKLLKSQITIEGEIVIGDHEDKESIAKRIAAKHDIDLHMEETEIRLIAWGPKKGQF